jgi:hypothetical protein
VRPLFVSHSALKLIACEYFHKRSSPDFRR